MSSHGQPPVTPGRRTSSSNEGENKSFAERVALQADTEERITYGRVRRVYPIIITPGAGAVPQPLSAELVDPKPLPPAPHSGSVVRPSMFDETRHPKAVVGDFYYADGETTLQRTDKIRRRKTTAVDGHGEPPESPICTDLSSIDGLIHDRLDGHHWGLLHPTHDPQHARARSKSIGPTEGSGRRGSWDSDEDEEKSFTVKQHDSWANKSPRR